ncbi:MAG: kelch repeat-containing protein, partial [Egibacteraceae bacterium]
PLVIDPILDYSTYLGGTGRDGPTGIVVDDTGAAYISGYTTSPNFPTTPGAFQTEGAPGEQDGYVTKLTPDGSDIEYSTYLSGSGEDYPSAIAVDDTGAAYITGSTQSDDFPTTAGAFQEAPAGGNLNAFLTKLNADGTALEYSTYLGGTSSDFVFAIAVDDAGSAHVAGTTSSDDYPTTTGAFQEMFPGGGESAFLTKVSADGTDTDWSTFVGGTDADTASGVHVGDDGTVSLAGDTRSADLPTTAGAYQEDNPSGVCASGSDPDRLCLSTYAMQFDAAGDQVLGTYVGGEGDDQSGAPSRNGEAAQTIGLAADGSMVVIGGTNSPDFPLSDDAFQQVLQDGTPQDGRMDIGFVTRLESDGSDIIYSTFLGGRRNVDSVAVEPDGSATVIITAESDLIALRDPVAPYSGNHDVYVGRLNPEGTDLVYGTFIAGRLVDLVRGLALGPDGSAYVIADTQSDDFPVTPGAFETAPPGGLSGFVARLAPTEEGVPHVSELSPRSGPENGGTTVTLTGRDLSGATAVDFGGTPAEDFTVDSDTQITATSPPGSDPVHVTVTTPEGTSPANPAAEYLYAQGVWELAGQMASIRFEGSLTLLDDGRVLAAGGRNEIRDEITVDTAEVFDPLTGQWEDTGSLSGPRSHHSATLLPDGRVLVAGGFAGSNDQLATAEVYDPDTGQWTLVDEMTEGRARHLAVTLDDDRVLVTGGGGLDSTEIFDPATDTWETTGAMVDARSNFAGDVLADGRVMVAGGGGHVTRAAEIYDPATGEWTAVASMLADRDNPQGAALDDGRFLMISGIGAGKSAEVYDPDTDEWTASLMINDRWTALLGTLPDSTVLVAGGADGGSYAEVYDPDTNDWTTAGRMHWARSSWRSGHRGEMVVLSSDPDTFADDPAVCGEHCGKVLAATHSFRRVAELYTPEPSVTGVAPDTADADDEITITGFGFNDASAVHVGGEPATDVTVVSSTEVAATVPAQSAGTVDVTVTTP